MQRLVSTQYDGHMCHNKCLDQPLFWHSHIGDFNIHLLNQYCRIRQSTGKDDHMRSYTCLSGPSIFAYNAVAFSPTDGIYSKDDIVLVNRTNQQW